MTITGYIFHTWMPFLLLNLTIQHLKINFDNLAGFHLNFCSPQDYDDFDLNNEIDELEKFLKVPVDPAKAMKKEGTNGTVNGVAGSREVRYSCG